MSKMGRHASPSAKATGTRLFLQPAVFQYGRPPRFSAAMRANAVDMHFPWHEADSLVIELPAGCGLEHPDVPADLDIDGVCGYGVVLGTTHEGNHLVYRRRLHFDQYYFGRHTYDAVKAAFDAIHERDQHTLAVRPTAIVDH